MQSFRGQALFSGVERKRGGAGPPVSRTASEIKARTPAHHRGETVKTRDWFLFDGVSLGRKEEMTTRGLDSDLEKKGREKEIPPKWVLEKKSPSPLKKTQNGEKQFHRDHQTER